MEEPFDLVIPRAADGDQPPAGTVYGLMVGGIYQGAVSVELIKEVTASQIAVIYIVKLIMTDPFMDAGGVDVLCDVAAEMDVDELKPFADSQHGLFFCHKTGQELELQDIEFSIHISGTVILLAEKGGCNVAAAGEKQVGGMVCGLRMEGGMTGDAKPFQGFFIVFCMPAAACDDYGWEKGHVAYSFCGGEALLYFMQKTDIGLKNI